eukprot:233501_1
MCATYSFAEILESNIGNIRSMDKNSMEKCDDDVMADASSINKCILDKLLIYGYLRKIWIHHFPVDIVYVVSIFWGQLLNEKLKITIGVSNDYTLDDEMCQSLCNDYKAQKAVIQFNWNATAPKDNITLIQNYEKRLNRQWQTVATENSIFFIPKLYVSDKVLLVNRRSGKVISLGSKANKKGIWVCIVTTPPCISKFSEIPYQVKKIWIPIQRVNNIITYGKKFDLTVGDHVIGRKKGYCGIIKYVGPTHFDKGIWFGVALDNHGPKGKNNGTVKKKYYFECEENCGIMLPYRRLRSTTNT